MRLSEMRPRRDDAPLPADVEAELAALDAALAGDEVPAGMEGLATLVSDLEAERATPGATFSEKLDEWAAAGFPRDDRPGRVPSAADPFARVRTMKRRRQLAFAGAAATLVVIAIGVTQVDLKTDGEALSGDVDDAAFQSAEEAPPVIDEARPGVAEISGADPGAGFTTKDAAGRASANFGGLSRDPNSPARGRSERKVERDAQLTLAAPADEVQDVTNDAIGVIRAHDGIVDSSQTSAADDSARATLQLLIPTRELDATLDELSDLADVKSLSEGTEDITRPFIDTKKRMDGLRAERRSLLAQIEAADTAAELDALKDRLAAVEQTLAQAEADFRNVQRRAALSSVTLQITSEGARDGDWSIEDALDDAGRVLTVAAGIALITAAVLLPLALIAAIAYFVLSAARNRSREKALDD